MVHPVESSGSGWFSWLWAKSGTDILGDEECVDIVGSRRKNGVFSSLTDDERHQLHAALVQLEAPADNEKHRDDIGKCLPSFTVLCLFF